MRKDLQTLSETGMRVKDVGVYLPAVEPDQTT